MCDAARSSGHATPIKPQFFMAQPSAYIDFAAVKAAVSLERILIHYGILETLKRSGAESLRGCCPIHKGVNPAQFSVTLSKNAWKCFSECQHGGNQLDLVMRMENCTLHEAAWKVNEWFNLGLGKNATPATRNTEKRKPSSSMPESKPASEKTAPRSPSPTPTEPEPEETGSNKPLAFALQNLDSAHDYLRERGLTPETITEFGLGHCPKGIMAGRIVIPIHNPGGELVAYAGRWPGTPAEGKEKYRLPAGFKKSLELFNIHRASKEPRDSPLIIVEGFFDVMRYWKAGQRRVVALMGTHLSGAQEQLIRENLGEDDQVILSLDDDAAGQNAIPGILTRIARHSFVRVSG